MARAKRTDRAAARRRYRAATVDPLEESGLDAEPGSSSPDAASQAARPAGAPRSSASIPATPRPSLTGAFRASFRPIDLRGDLRYLPMLLRHWSFLLPTILSGLSVALIPLVGVNALTSAFYQYFSFTAPLGTAFLAGFLAPRASWLVGLLAALASVGFQALAFNFGSFGGFLDAFTDPTTGLPATREAARTLVLGQALFVGVPSGALFAAAAAWYKRFLNRASPNRGKPPTSGGKRPDGRQPKRDQQRPILARRR